MYTRRFPAAAIAVAAALSLGACSADADDAASAPETAPAGTEAAADAAVHNAADTRFAQMMIVHHEGAVEMAELAIERADTDEVRALGERIAAAQGPEIAMMSGWLTAWGEDQPADADMSGMGHESMEMDGMYKENVMDDLTALAGPDFDRRFLELMIDHHRGAIEMGEEQRGEGENGEALRLAGTIIDDQMAEITEMTNLLNAR